MNKQDNTKTLITKKIAGADVHLYINGECIGGQADCELQQERILIDTTCKGDNTENCITRVNSWTMNCNGFYVTNDKGITALLDAYDFGEVVTVELKHKKYKDYFRKGQAIMLSLTESSLYTDATRYEITFKGISQLTKE